MTIAVFLAYAVCIAYAALMLAALVMLIYNALYDKPKTPGWTERFEAKLGGIPVQIKRTASFILFKAGDVTEKAPAISLTGNMNGLSFGDRCLKLTTNMTDLELHAAIKSSGMEIISSSHRW